MKGPLIDDSRRPLHNAVGSPYAVRPGPNGVDMPKYRLFDADGADMGEMRLGDTVWKPGDVI